MDRNAPMTIPELGLLALIAVLKGPPIYYCIRVKLRPRRKKKSKRDNGLFCFSANAHAWMSCILCQYALARTIWKNARLITALNHK